MAIKFHDLLSDLLLGAPSPSPGSTSRRITERETGRILSAISSPPTSSPSSNNALQHLFSRTDKSTRGPTSFAATQEEEPPPPELMAKSPAELMQDFQLSYNQLMRYLAKMKKAVTGPGIEGGKDAELDGDAPSPSVVAMTEGKKIQQDCARIADKIGGGGGGRSILDTLQGYVNGLNAALDDEGLTSQNGANQA
ncbi:unnamed protein product [Amoebophrya sp. A25]|nr:unnamed protein product [Amoebophrya sp. A25]|eukprot:GSA25T00010075001.1